ncbi:hypothetical protein JW887_06745 [Candidatus Dojkabacteria bacterium]|nr:hypothetical protein [Candidatus Dojkabacteria bacterium]
MEYLVIKLGGSVISPKEGLLNEDLVNSYCKEIVEFYQDKENLSRRLILVVGGGNISREYRDAAKRCHEDSDSDLHKIGIAATWLNAELFRSILSDIAHPLVLGVGAYAEDRKEGESRITKYFEDWLSSNTPVLVCGGFLNGASTDYNAFLLASKIGVNNVYKLSNIPYIYNSDPKENPTAVPIEDISWVDYETLVGEKGIIHKPGANLPIDLFAADFAKNNNIKCLLGAAEKKENFPMILRGKRIDGTLIHV